MRPRLRRGPLLLALGALALAAVVGAGVLLARDTGPARAVAPSPSASAPRAPALAGTDPITGRAVSLADYAGKPVVINVWASWCPGCIAEARALAEFAADHPEVEVLGIDFSDNRADARRFYREHRWRHASIFDPRGELAAQLGLSGMPTTYFLNARHEIVTRIVGATDRAGFEDGLQAALAG